MREETYITIIKVLCFGDVALLFMHVSNESVCSTALLLSKDDG
jgi:hypothetical protein